ncbi:MAG: PqqD family protein [Deltaproteobacteria bacterium]|nr:PqqD family protein [Deltaproteobacteria bacterium]
MNSCGCPKQIEGLEINQVEDGFVIYHPGRDTVHFLNPSALLVLELCDGKHEAGGIPAIVQKAYGLEEAPEKEIRELLVRLLSEGLIDP